MSMNVKVCMNMNLKGTKFKSTINITVEWVLPFILAICRAININTKFMASIRTTDHLWTIVLNRETHTLLSFCLTGVCIMQYGNFHIDYLLT